MQANEKRRILVVDDQPNVTELVKMFLEKTDRYIVFTQNRSAAALEAAQQVQPDLIILDIDMPGKDGGEVAREIRLSKQFHSTPILFLTGLIQRNGQKFLS